MCEIIDPTPPGLALSLERTATWELTEKLKTITQDTARRCAEIAEAYDTGNKWDAVGAWATLIGEKIRREFGLEIKS